MTPSERIAHVWPDVDDTMTEAEVAAYRTRYDALCGSPEHAAAAEEFFLLCMVAFGDMGVRTKRDLWALEHDAFYEFRHSVHPTYFKDPEVPVLEPGDYINWYRAKKNLGDLPEPFVKDDDEEEQE